MTFSCCGFRFPTTTPQRANCTSLFVCFFFFFFFCSLIICYFFLILVLLVCSNIELNPIDLIFTNHQNLARDSGMYATLNSKCHHQIIYYKLNLKTEYSPPYTHEIWEYRAETDLINRSIECFDWSKLFFR